MAAGVPVVQPDHGAYPEILSRTGGGLLVPNNDAAIADGLLSLWRDPARAAALGQRGAHGVRAHYSADRMATRALGAYERALARSPLLEAQPAVPSH
jgi:glycosyltransferase involved in cell wall biosynthesis